MFLLGCIGASPNVYALHFKHSPGFLIDVPIQQLQYWINLPIFCRLNRSNTPCAVCFPTFTSKFAQEKLQKPKNPQKSAKKRQTSAQIYDKCGTQEAFGRGFHLRPTASAPLRDPSGPKPSGRPKVPWSPDQKSRWSPCGDD